MTFLRHVPLALATMAAAGCATGWYMSSNVGAEHDFSSCERSGGVLALEVSHGYGQEIRVSRKPHGNGDVTVTLRLISSDGPNVMLQHFSTVRLDDLGGRVLDGDGKELACRDGDAGREARSPE